MSPWQYVGIPAICGAALAVLLVLFLMAIGVPGRDLGQAVAPANQVTAKRETLPEQDGPEQHGRGQYGRVPERGQLDFNARLLLFLMTKRHDLLMTELPGAGGNGGAGENSRETEKGGAAAKPGAGGKGAADEARRGAETDPAAVDETVAGVGPKRKRVRWGLEFWRTPLFAGAAWSFGDSWVTSVTPLTALAGGVLTASGAVSGLVPGVDLTRFGLLMALVGGLTTLAPLLFGAVNALFPAKDTGDPAPTGEVVAASLWVMLLASCLTVFAIGAEIGFVGLVLGFDLIVASPSIRWIGPAVTGLAAVLFLGFGAHSILTLIGQPSGAPKKTAAKSSFMM